MSKLPPQKIPKWLASFAEFVRKSDNGHETNNTLEVYNVLLATHWELFYLEMKDKKKDKPAQKKKTDPWKTLETPMCRVAELVQNATNNPVLLQQYQDRLVDIIPAEIMALLPKF